MNTFTCTILNRLDQLGQVDFEVVIKHDQEIIPEYRVWKNYQIDPDLIDEDFVDNLLESEVQLLVDNWNNQQQ